jgi:hypothetical protein
VVVQSVQPWDWQQKRQGTGVSDITLQPDGDLVAHDEDDAPLRSTGTAGCGVAMLEVRDDVDVVLLDNDGEIVWHTDTATTDIQLSASTASSAEVHGGADSARVDELLRLVADGGSTETSPVAAREAVAVVASTKSLRSNGTRVTVPELDLEIVGYFDDQFQLRRLRPTRTS